LEHFIAVGICQFHLNFLSYCHKVYNILSMIFVLISFSSLLSHIFVFFLEKSCHRFVQSGRLPEDHLLVFIILLLYVLYLIFFIYFLSLLFLVLKLVWVYFASLFLTYFKIWFTYSWASLVAQMVKNLPAVQETRVPSLFQEDPLETGMATHSSFLAWRIPRTEKPGGLQVIGS